MTAVIVRIFIRCFYGTRGPIEIVHYYQCPGGQGQPTNPPAVGRNYSIYTGRDADSPSYGPWIDYSFHPSAEKIEPFLQRASVQWTDEGVTLELPSGHRLFIPEKMFTGGR
jgi:hypothetical protein